MENLDRSIITNEILNGSFVKEQLISPNKSVKYGIIGHSLGCGTATNTGDKSWVRVCIAGFPGERPDTVGGDMLFISSVNDGAVSLERLRINIPTDFVRMNENDECIQSSILNYQPNLEGQNTITQIPRRTAVVFERANDAPNHISFLADGVNNAMIDLLSPLLPIAQALQIPVLDFDKYKLSQDSDRTAKTVIPLVSMYLRQRMLI